MSEAQAALLPQDALGDLGGAPVEAALRQLLSGPLDEAALGLLHRYQRKLDIGRKLVQRYADGLGAAQSEQEISRPAYLALAHAFGTLASREAGVDEASRARRLRYVNSACNCVDKLDASASQVAGLQARLDALALEASPCPSC